MASSLSVTGASGGFDSGTLTIGRFGKYSAMWQGGSFLVSAEGEHFTVEVEPGEEVDGYLLMRSRVRGVAKILTVSPLQFEFTPEEA